MTAKVSLARVSSVIVCTEWHVQEYVIVTESGLTVMDLSYA